MIFDSTGKKLVENIASVDVYVLLDSFKEKEGINDAKLEKVLDTLGGILGDSWKKEIIMRILPLLKWFIVYLKRSICK